MVCAVALVAFRDERVQILFPLHLRPRSVGSCFGIRQAESAEPKPHHVGLARTAATSPSAACARMTFASPKKVVPERRSDEDEMDGGADPSAPGELRDTIG